MKVVRWLYPTLVGLLLGLLQAGLYFQLSFTLSSSFRTFLMITVSWLSGSVVGIQIARRLHVDLNTFILLALAAYFACAVVLGAAPFNTQLWPVYAVLVGFIGLYPGVFFVRASKGYSAHELFFKENNGFIAGLISGTILFLLLGRAALWVMPVVVAIVVMICTRRLHLYQHGVETIADGALPVTKRRV